MKYLLGFLLVVCSRIVYAEDLPKYDIYGNTTEVIKIIESEEPQPEQTFKVEFPACNDTQLLAKTKEAIAEYEKEMTKENIIELRHRLLAQKNLSSFFEQKTENFSYKDNRMVANILITEKFNGKYQNDDFRICVSENPVLKRRVYLLLQKYSDTDILVRLINYHLTDSVKFIYKK